jgi:hypothetical protein
MSDGTAVFAEKSKSFYSAQIYEEAREKNAQILDRLCDLEDKICEGKIVELPCKIGQTVYVPWEWEGQEGIASTIVECIQIVRDAKLCGFFIDMKSDDTAFNDVYGFWRTFADIGKTVFLDRAAAEAKLREMEGAG